MSNTFHTISGGTILSQVLEEYAPVIPPHPSKSLSIYQVERFGLKEGGGFFVRILLNCGGVT